MVVPLGWLAIAALAAGVGLLIREEMSKGKTHGPKHPKHAHDGAGRDLAGEQRPASESDNRRGGVTPLPARPRKRGTNVGVVTANVADRAGSEPSDNSGSEHEPAGGDRSPEPVGATDAAQTDAQATSGEPEKSAKSKGRAKPQKADTPSSEVSE